MTLKPCFTSSSCTFLSGGGNGTNNPVAPGAFSFLCEECEGRGYWLEGLHQEEMGRVDCPDCGGNGLTLLGRIEAGKEKPEPWPPELDEVAA